MTADQVGRPLPGCHGSFLEDHGKGSANLGRFLVADFS